MTIGSIKNKPPLPKSFAIHQPLINSFPLKGSSESTSYLSRPTSLQAWSSAMVVFPVLLQAPWVHLHPSSACLFTFVLLASGVLLVQFKAERWENVGSLLVGVSGSWLGGCLFWGWLREYPLFHLPVESLVLPIACVGLTLATKWRIGAAFYLSCLFGTAATDLMMWATGVMPLWPAVVKAPLQQAPELLNFAAGKLLSTQSILLLLLAAIIISFLADFMYRRSSLNSPLDSPWLVASAALTTTIWIDGLFIITAFFQPKLSGLI